MSISDNDNDDSDCEFIRVKSPTKKWVGLDNMDREKVKKTSAKFFPGEGKALGRDEGSIINYY